MKKVILSLLVILMLGTLSACGKTQTNDDTLTVMCVGTAADNYTEAYQSIADEFSKDNEYDVKVKIEFYELEQYKTKLTTLMASNAEPDIFFTDELAFLEPYVNSGKVVDITSYLNEDEEWKNRFAEGTLDLLSYDGKNYGIPTQKSLCVMFYNKEIFKENGISVPVTYNDFLNACDTLKANGVTPMTLCGTDAWIPAQFVQQIAGGMAGSEMFYAICDGEETWNNEYNVAAAEEMNKMAEAGYFQEGYLGTSAEESTSLFESGGAAMYFQGAWDAGRIYEKLGEDAGSFVMPAYNEQYNNISVGSVDTSFAVSEQCKNVDAAVAFLKYWTSQETEEMLLYDCGRIPSSNFKVDESRVNSLMAEVLAISNDQIGLTPWWDRQFGAKEGNEFNNTCVAVLAGDDAQSSFDALQKYAEDNAERQ